MNNILIKIDDFCNAILIKELRQSARGKFLWITLIIFLVVLCYLFLNTLNARIKNNYGLEIAEYLISCLLFCSFFIIPLSISKKISKERSDGTNELLFTTIMTPKQIVYGKFLCGITEITMLFCVVSPFVLLTVFVGGVDIQDLIFSLIVCYVSSALGIMMQITFGLSSYGINFFNYIAKIFYFIVQFSVWIIINFRCIDILSGRGFFYLNNEKNLYIIVLIAAFVCWFILFKFSESLLQPETSNRTYSLRKYITIVLFVLISMEYLVKELSTASIVLFVLLLGGVSLQIFGEPDSYSKRVIREIPESFGGKYLKFPLFTGFANGLSWLIIFYAIGVLYAWIINDYTLDFSKAGNEFKEGIIGGIVISMTISSYCLFGNFIRKIFFKNKPAKENRAIAFILFVLFGLMPIMPVIPLGKLYSNGDFWNLIRIFNPISCVDTSDQDGLSKALLFAVIGFVIALIFNWRFVAKQTGNYFNGISKEDEE